MTFVKKNPRIKNSTWIAQTLQENRYSLLTILFYKNKVAKAVSIFKPEIETEIVLTSVRFRDSRYLIDRVLL